MLKNNGKAKKTGSKILRYIQFSSWEFPQPAASPFWYAGMLALFVILVVTSIIFSNFLLMIILFLLAVITIQANSKKPQKIFYKLYSRGIKKQGLIIPWSAFGSFHIAAKKEKITHVIFYYLGYLKFPLMIFQPKIFRSDLEKILRHYLPEKTAVKKVLWFRLN